MRLPYLLVSDSTGDIFEIPELSMAASSLDAPVLPGPDNLIPMPRSSLLFTLPGRAAMGYDPGGRLVTITEYGGKRVFPVAAFMPPGYLRTLHCAYAELPGAPRLPLYCYAAVGWKNERFYVAGTRIDRRLCHEIADSILPEVDRKAAALLARHPRNRLVAHLVHNCVLKYRCPNACNLTLNKGECPVPISPACNASCIGCISRQPKSAGFPSSQHRIDFVPTVTEILDYAVPHCASAPRPIVSFGQGCEGEPLLQEELVEEAIRGIRLRTKRGTININTNASIPAAIRRLCRAGLNSMRVSLNSAQEGFYGTYYRPAGYSFEDVRESIRIAKRLGAWVSLNYLVFPGFTDDPSEIKALKELLRDSRIDMLQTRNLNVDPQWFCREMNFRGLTGNAIGMPQWVNCIRKAFPKVRLGYFNPASV
jgi:pyruvate-formate lyase-activating enzyme